ncbi:ribonuclease HII, partial [bacterium]|nr:ribonuclease HII [bacterium]
IMSNCLDYGVGIASNEEIDRYNIGRATSIAMKRAICELYLEPDYLLIDGNLNIPDFDLPQKCIIKGDSLSLSIAAASILAKVTRDKIMEEYHYKFPEYNFLGNKGYGTQDHVEALEKYGPCEIHRKSFEPVKTFFDPYKQALLF